MLPGWVHNHKILIETPEKMWKDPEKFGTQSLKDFVPSLWTKSALNLRIDFVTYSEFHSESLEKFRSEARNECFSDCKHGLRSVSLNKFRTESKNAFQTESWKVSFQRNNTQGDSVKNPSSYLVLNPRWDTVPSLRMDLRIVFFHS